MDLRPVLRALDIRAQGIVPNPSPGLPPGEFSSGGNLLLGWIVGGGIFFAGIAIAWAAIAFFKAQRTGESFRDQFSTLGGIAFGLLLLLSIGSIISAFVALGTE